MNLKYRRLGYQYAHDLPEQWSEEDDIEELAEAAAEDYWRNWRNHDGWEARWPLTFEILLPNGEVLGMCSVSLDIKPVFVVTTHNDEAHRRDAAGGPSGGADCSAA
jgi:hypothetical protein